MLIYLPGCRLSVFELYQADLFSYRPDLAVTLDKSFDVSSAYTECHGILLSATPEKE